MGIDNAAARLLIAAHSDGEVDFSNTLVVGRQKNYITNSFAKKLAKNLSISYENFREQYSEFLFKALGANNLNALDVSDYEGANILHDLNVPLRSELKGKFNCVVDIGTSEHVMDALQSISNLRDLCSVGGHVIMLNPSNNWLGHGFYQFSPELFYRGFSEEFGFKIKYVFLIEKRIFGERWFKLNDPKNQGRRISIKTKGPTYLGVIAEKISNSNVGTSSQSDYELAWGNNQVSRFGAYYLRLPKKIQRIIYFMFIVNLERYRNKLSRYRPKN